VDIGEIGAVTAIHTFFSYMNTDPKNIRNKKVNGGGALMDIGCYAVSSSRFILGKEPQRVMSLVTIDPSFKIDSQTSGILDFGDSRCLFTSSTQSNPFQRVEIHGAAGFLSVNIPFNPYTDVPVTIDVVTSIGRRSIPFGPVDQYRNQFDACSRAIIEGKEFPYPASDGVANMRVIDALFKSAESGTWERV
ncbi:MAG TPA: Gfo/Idh/MocA family oxidoreductase, partial [Spirochaetia bacterium]|nr:Gfo/Idh/MocA family oxidoreductase [Spirochaetia bacterium]